VLAYGYFILNKTVATKIKLTENMVKSSIFWYVTPCNPLQVNRCFGGMCRLHLQGKLCLPPASCWLLAWVIFRIWRWRRYVPLKDRPYLKQATRHHIPQDRTLYNHGCENLRSLENTTNTKTSISFTRGTANGGMTFIVLLKYAHCDYNPKLNDICQPKLFSLMTCRSIHLQKLKNSITIFTLLESGNTSSKEMEYHVQFSAYSHWCFYF
jgi:hypothetical protein